MYVLGGPPISAAMVIESVEDLSGLASRLRECLKLRELRNGPQELVLRPRTEPVDLTQHLDKLANIERSSPRRAWPPLEGVMIGIESGRQGIPKTLIVAVDNDKIGGKQTRVFVRQIERIVIRKNDDGELEALLEAYTGVRK